MLVNALLLLLCVLETLQHLSYPINFCNMASTCVHDSRVVCASSPDGCSRKSFLDQCDMYEYNCDYGTQYMTKVTSSCTSGYQETYILFCGTLLTSTQFTEITKNPTNHGTSPSSSKQTTKDYEDDCCNGPLTVETTTEITHIIENITTQYNYSEEDQIDKSVIEKDDTNSTTGTSIEYDIFDDLYDQTTNIHENENENNIIPITTNQQVSDPVTLDGTTLFENTETDGSLEKKLTVIDLITQNSPTYCCNRPITWETTTEVTHNFEDITTENNNSDENNTEKTVTEQDENKQTTETRTETTTDTTTKTTTETTTETITETTTEKTTDYNFTDNSYEKTIDIHENENNITSQQVNNVTLDETTLYKKKETEPLNKKLTDRDIVTQRSSGYCCNRPLTWETKTKATNVFEIVATENNSDENKISGTVQDQDVKSQTTAASADTTDSYIKVTTKYSTTSATNEELNKKLVFFSTQTKCNNCQRPLTWLTTLRRRRYF